MADNDNVREKELLLAVYDEDVVQTKDKKKIGIVLETPRDDDSSNSSDDEEEEEEKVEKGKILVSWYTTHSKWNTDEQVVDENSVELVDRSLLPGDVVRWVSKSSESQKGQIMDVNVDVDIRIVGTNYLLKGINTKELKPLNIYNEGEFVVMDSWLGRINDVSLEITLKLKNGSRCIVKGDAVDNLSDITDQRDEDSTFYCSDFYPGQQVQGPARVFKEARWITGSRPAISNHGRLKAIVEELVTKSLEVGWQLCGYTGNTSEDTMIQPNNLIESTVLNSGLVKVVDQHSEANIQIGDKAYYVLKEADVENYKFATEIKREKKEPSSATATANPGNSSDNDDEDEDIGEDGEESDNEIEKAETTETRRTPSTTQLQHRRPRRKRNAHPSRKKKRYQPPVVISTGSKVCVEICRTNTVANTVWQNAVERNHIMSTKLCPVIRLDELEFFPGDFVVDKRGDSTESDRFGVVQSSDFQARLVNICWLSFTSSTAETEKVHEKDISVYDIGDHENYTYRIGDVVVRLAIENHDVLETTVQRYPPAGTVLKVNGNGAIVVKWVDDTISSVLPSQILLLSYESDDAQSDGFNEESGDEDADEWETASDTSDTQDNPNEHLNPLEDVIMRSLAALHTTTNSNDRSTPILEMNQRTHEFINALDQQFVQNPTNESSATAEEGSTDKCSNETSIRDTIQHGSSSDESVCKKKRGNSVSNVNDSPCEEINPNSGLVSFVTLDCTPSTHHFYKVGDNFTPSNQRSFNQAVMKDIRLLKTHLPEGILVRTFEGRMDLYSVLISGPQATPYEDGLFYFDLQLPENYPASPPVVHYHSYCSARLNPNLYENGKVCVSLLGTWSGKGSETWTSKSTIHQVLASIQGLILCEEPYYNEAGYESSRGSTEAMENSRMYNEMAVVKMMQSIQLMISRPPDIFKDEVLQHFKEHLPKILERFGSWLSDDTGEKKSFPSYPLFPISKGFCASVSRVLAQLKEVCESQLFTT